MVEMARAFLLCLGFLLILSLRFLFLDRQNNFHPGQQLAFQTTLSVEPEVLAKSQRFKVEGLQIISTRYPEYHYGDKLKISGVIRTGRLGSGSLFGFLLNNQETKWVVNFPQIEKLEENRGNWLIASAWGLRRRLIANYKVYLPEPEASLLSGIVLGAKTQMSSGFKDDLRKTGLTHVVVASGMNVTLVAGFLSGMLTVFLRRQLTLPLILLGIFFYAFLAGFEAPIVRAALMGSLAVAAQSLGRQSWAALSLAISGSLMLFVSPTLLSDLGFQLSFLATGGLIFIKPQIDKLGPIGFLAKMPVFGESVTTTLSAQLMTLPLILATFGGYSPFSILTNSLVLWTIPWIMGIGGIAGIFGLLFEPLGQLVSFGSYPFLYYFERVVYLFAHFPFWQVSKVPTFFWLAYFSFLMSGLIFLAQKQKKETDGVGNKV